MQVAEHVPVREELVVLKDDADAAPQAGDVAPLHATQVEPYDAPLALDERYLGVKRLDERAFAAAHLADEIDHFAFAYREIHARNDHLSPLFRVGRTRFRRMEYGHVPQFYHRILLHAGCTEKIKQR